MKVIQKEIRLNSEEYYTTHLNVINSLFTVKLTEKELEILAGFMSLDTKLTESDMFNTFARKIVKEKLGNMSSGSLSNHLKSMINKGFLVKDDITNKISIKGFLIPENDWQGYQFKIIKDGK